MEETGLWDLKRLVSLFVPCAAQIAGLAFLSEKMRRARKAAFPCIGFAVVVGICPGRRTRRNQGNRGASDRQNEIQVRVQPESQCPAGSMGARSRQYLQLAGSRVCALPVHKFAFMNIAILGTRGIPGRYGGFETLADELSQRLVERGHRVRVYCRRPFTNPEDVFDHRIQRVILPTLSNKHFDTLFHTFLSILHVIFTDVEVILICNVASSPFAWLPRLFGKPTALNVDGLDRKRRKWNFIGRAFLHFCEVLSTLTPTRVITDARAGQDYYKKRYGADSAMIGYGAKPMPNGNHFNQFGLNSRKYILYVARLEPENNAELVIQAYRELQTDWPLVVVGGNPYQPGYVEKLKSLAGDRVVFTGPIYGERYWSLQKNAGLFVFAGEIGGIHPALVEAMAAGNVILYLDTEANRETASGCGIPFQLDTGNLRSKLEELIASPGKMESMRTDAADRASKTHNWETVTDQYENIFHALLDRRQNG